MNFVPDLTEVQRETLPAPRTPFRWTSYGLSRMAVYIICLKLAGLALLLWATFAALGLRDHVVDTTIESLSVQADAAAALLSGTVGPPLVTLEAATPPAGAGTAAPSARSVADRDAVERALAAATAGSRARVQVYGVGGGRLADSATALTGSGDVAATPLPPLPDDVGARVPASAVPPEVESALGGVKSVSRRIDADGDLVVTVATPLVSPTGAVVGALAVRSGPDTVLAATRDQEQAVIRGFMVAAAVAILVSLVLVATINRPLNRLAFAAERVKAGASALAIPELNRSDTIGQLSRAFRDMTQTLTHRMAATEAFAAEVAHELKNPLTSLRSAVETLPKARTDRSRDELLAVIHHDVRRIDRLISDISDASRLDAELTRSRFARFDLVHLLQHVVVTEQELAAERGQAVTLTLRSPPRMFMIEGNDSRLGQVFTNLIDNARSFTPDGGHIAVTAERFEKVIEVVVDDEGPGVDESVLERIFERFYTDRPGQAHFGNNSGLGLAISRQIIAAHGGEIFAENRYRTTLLPGRDVAGARFTVRLPMR